MSLLGIHLHGLDEILLDRNKEIFFFQFFVNPQKNYLSKTIDEVIKYTKKHGIKLVVHSSYTINIAKKWHEYDWWVEYIINEIHICNEIGAFGLVIHTGNKLSLSEAEGINNMYTLLLHIHRKTSATAPTIKLLIETPAGQGTEMLCDIGAYCKFMSKFFCNNNIHIQQRFGCCIDSSHIFAAGYNVTNKNELSRFFLKIDKTIGLDKIKLCHLNDSRGKFGSHIDRHANIGDGHIGKKNIISFAKIMNSLGVPIILETPLNKLYDDFNIIRDSLST